MAVHSTAEFTIRFPFTSFLWRLRSNSVVLLSVQDEPALIEFIGRLKANGIRHAVFREPDIDNQITSVTIEPTSKARTICAGLPLALKEFKAENKINKRTYEKLTSNHQLIT